MFRLLIVAGLLLLTGCAGSAYRFPDVSSTDLQLMDSKIANNKVALKKYERSDQKYSQIIGSVTSRLTKSAKPLCQSADYPSCRFSVIYDSGDTMNAYASEGYKITVFRGLLQYMKNNDEIAAVIAHEMGHHLAHHNEEKAQNAAAGAAVTGILTAVLLGAANANNPGYNAYQQQQNDQTIKDMMNVGAKIGVISYSKEQEREADLLGAYLMARAGYNLDAAKNMLFVLSGFSGEHGAERASLLDSHPAGPERIVAWEKAIAEIKNNPSKLPYLNEAASR